MQKLPAGSYAFQGLQFSHLRDFNSAWEEIDIFGTEYGRSLVEWLGRQDARRPKLRIDSGARGVENRVNRDVEQSPQWPWLRSNAVHGIDFRFRGNLIQTLADRPIVGDRNPVRDLVRRIDSERIESKRHRDDPNIVPAFLRDINGRNS